MPGIDGWQVISKVKRLAPHVPVILCSGYQLEDECPDIDDDFRPDAFVEKPYRSLDLLTALRQVLTDGARKPAHVE